MMIRKQDLEALKASFKNGVTVRTVLDKRQSIPDFEVADAPDFRISHFLKGLTFGNWSGATDEKRVFEKAYQTDAGSQGGWLVPETFEPGIVPRLVEESVIRSMPGVKVVPMGAALSRNYTGIGNPPQVSWGEEGGTISEDTHLSLRKMRMAMKKATCIVLLSRELIESPGADADLIIKQELSTAMGEATDHVLLEGLGGEEPTGLFYNPDVLHTDLNGVSVDLQDVLSAEYQLRVNKAKFTGAVTSPAVRHALRSLVDANGRNLIQPGDQLGAYGTMDLDTLYGRPLASTTQVSVDGLPTGSNESYMVMGMWSDLVVGDGNLRIESSIHDQWSKDLVSVRLVKRLGSVLLHGVSFAVVKGIKAN
jgi:HK97 family phage major capsid protein